MYKKTAILLILWILCTILSSCEYIQTKEVMGTFSEIKSDDKTSISNAYNEIKKIEQMMSIYEPDTEISILNTNKSIKISDELGYVINKSILFSEISDSSFDITILPLLDLYKTSFKEHNSPPSDIEIQKEMKKVSYKNIIVQGNMVQLMNNSLIDLGGIAKGHAIDKALEQLESGIVNIGGDIGIKSRSTIIALANTDNTDQFIAKFSLDNGCIATSGNYERYFDKTKKAHHIMDPRTGKSAQGLLSVTIIGKNRKAIDCDALATSVFVMGKDKGLKLINSLDGFETMIIDENNSFNNSSRLTDFLISD